ncbi:MAG: hypothetical protein JW807_14275 [Spirochaetes bacterium]|nr:hypothetical protein [Spirochaetota bacterium]
MSKKLLLEKKNGFFLCNGKSFTALSVRPKYRSETRIITKYGGKSYDGYFTITLKNNSFYIINTTSMNSYLRGVVGSELGENFNLEVLKAQAVVSRSYYVALNKNSTGRDYDAIDVAGQFQAYRGLQYAGPRVKKAVNDTRCEILHNSGDDDFIPQFHSTCGGILLTPGESRGNDTIREHPNFRRFDGPRNSPNCRISPYYEWSADIEKKVILKALSKQLCKDFDDITFFVDNNGFLKQVTLIIQGDRIITIKGFQFKSYLEKEYISSVRSTRVNIHVDGDTVHFKGKGYGHFVGMCQWGAEFLARKGLGYRDILRYYYPTAAIVYMNECP